MRRRREIEILRGLVVNDRRGNLRENSNKKEAIKESI